MRAQVVLPLVLACTPALAASPDYERRIASIDTVALTRSQPLECGTAIRMMGGLLETDTLPAPVPR